MAAPDRVPCSSSRAMANTTSDSAAQQLRDEAAQHRRQALALEARAAALTELNSPDSVAGALEHIDKHAIRLQGCLRSDATPEAMSEMLDVIADLRAAARSLDSSAGKVERKIRKLERKPASGASRSAASRAATNRLMTPPPDDLTVLDNPLTATDAWLSAKEYAPSTVANVRAAMQRYVDVSEERGLAPYELEPTEVLSVTQIKASTALFRWINTYRAGSSITDGETLNTAAEAGEAQLADEPIDADRAAGDDADLGDGLAAGPAGEAHGDGLEQAHDLGDEAEDASPPDELDTDGADDGSNDFLREQDALMRTAVTNRELLPYTRIAIAAGIARIPPLEVVNLRHEQVSTSDGITTVALEDDKTFTISDELYEAMCEWSGRREGLLMVDSDGNRLAERAIGQSIGEALHALSGQSV